VVSFTEKCDDIYSSVIGWLITAGLVVANFFAGYGLIASAVLVAVVLDAVWGIASAIRRGKFAYSELMRDTITKLTSYGTALVICIFAEKLLNADTAIASSIVSAIICVTELWSMAGSILIINPRIPFFRLLRPALVGEIARKLQISEEEVKSALDPEADNNEKK